MYVQYIAVPLYLPRYLGTTHRVGAARKNNKNIMNTPSSLYTLFISILYIQYRKSVTFFGFYIVFLVYLFLYHFLPSDFRVM